MPCAGTLAAWALLLGGTLAPVAWADSLPPPVCARPAGTAPARTQALPSPDGTLSLLYAPEFRAADRLAADLTRYGLGAAKVGLVAPWVTEVRSTLPTPPPGQTSLFWPAWPTRPLEDPLPLHEAWRQAQKELPPQRVATRLLLTGPDESVRHLEAMLAHLDRPAAQVGVRLLVAEVRCSSRTESGGRALFGRDAADSASGGLFRGIDGTFEPDAWIRTQATGVLPFPGASIRFSRFIPIDGAFEHVLRGMAVRQDAELVAWPYLVCSEGTPCGLEVLSWVPSVTMAGSLRSSILTVPPPLDTGLRLGLGAVQVGADGALLDLRLQLRSAEPSTEVDATPGTLVQRSRDLSTRAAVRDGQSLLLGGVTLTRRVHTRNAFPWMGAVAPADLLLSARGSTVERTELLIVVLPRIRTIQY